VGGGGFTSDLYHALHHFLTSRKQKASKYSADPKKKPDVVAEIQKESSESEEEEEEEETMDLMSILKPSARGADKQSCSIPKVQKTPVKSKSSPAVIPPTSVQEVNKISTWKVPSTVVNTLDDKNQHQKNKQQCKALPSVPSATQEKRPNEKISMGRHSTTDHNRNKKATTDGHSAMIDRQDKSIAAAARQDGKIPTGLVSDKTVGSSSSQRPDSQVSAPVYEAKERIVDVKISGVLSSKVEIVLLSVRISSLHKLNIWKVGKMRMVRVGISSCPICSACA
jgi:hypothetical protein